MPAAARHEDLPTAELLLVRAEVQQQEGVTNVLAHWIRPLHSQTDKVRGEKRERLPPVPFSTFVVTAVSAKTVLAPPHSIQAKKVG